MTKIGSRGNSVDASSHESRSASRDPQSAERDVECLSRRNLLRTTALFGLASVGVTAGRAQSNESDRSDADGEPIFAVSEIAPVEMRANRGEQIEISATVENLGDAGGRGVVEFRIADETLRSTELSLDAGEQTTVTYQVSAPDLPGVYGYGIYTDEHSYTGQLTVTYDHPNSRLTVADLSPRELTIEQGEPITVTATISNTFGEETTETVTYILYGEDVASRTVTLDGGESTTVAFEITDTSGFEGHSAHAVRTAHDTVSGPATVTADDSDGENETTQSDSDGFGPGFGIGSVVTALGGASYLLKRHHEE